MGILTGKVALDTCGVLFFQAKYGGKTGYISEGYLDLKEFDMDSIRDEVVAANNRRDPAIDP